MRSTTVRVIEVMAESRETRYKSQINEFADEYPLLHIPFNPASFLAGLGLVAAANFRSGTTTMPFLVTIGISDLFSMTYRAFVFTLKSRGKF